MVFGCVRPGPARHGFSGTYVWECWVGRISSRANPSRDCARMGLRPPRPARNWSASQRWTRLRGLGGTRCGIEVWEGGDAGGDQSVPGLFADFDDFWMINLTELNGWPPQSPLSLLGRKAEKLQKKKPGCARAPTSRTPGKKHINYMVQRGACDLKGASAKVTESALGPGGCVKTPTPKIAL